MNITPLRGIIILTKKNVDVTSSSGIILSGDANTNTDTYIVKKVSKESTFTENQEVVFEGEPIAELPPQLTVISESQIIATVE